jgi:uncharacterized protein (TIRG00374 family)
LSSTEKPSAGRRRRWVLGLLGLAISILFIALLVRQVDAARLLDELRRVSLGRLSLALGTMAGALWMMSLRSGVLLAPLHRFGQGRLFKAILVVLGGNNVLPMRIGELLRVAYLARHGSLSYSSCLAVVGIERLLDIGVIALLFFALLPIAVVPLPRTAVLVGVALAAALGLGALVALARWPGRFVAACRALARVAGQRVSRWVGATVQRFADGLSSLRSVGRIVGAFCLTLGYWVFQLATMRVFLWAFDLALPWYAPGVLLVFIIFGVALPSSPAYVGTYHYFAQRALTLMGVEVNTATSVSIISHAAAVVPITLLAALLLAGELWRGELGARLEEPRDV